SKLWNVETYFDETLPVSGDLGNVFSANCFMGLDGTRDIAPTVGMRVDATNLLANPKYSNSSTGDYRLPASSPCVGKGLRATTTHRAVRGVTSTSATFDAAVNPNRMTHNVLLQVRRCNNTACTSVGPWTSTASTQVVGMVDLPVSRTITGL